MNDAMTARITPSLTDAELLPCPFCGGAAILRGHRTAPECWVACKCGACSDTGTKGRVIAAWNRRTPPPASRADADLRGAAVKAAVAEYDLKPALDDGADMLGRRCAVRGMMVRLGLYGEFNAALSTPAPSRPDEGAVWRRIQSERQPLLQEGYTAVRSVSPGIWEVLGDGPATAHNGGQHD